MAGGLSSGYIAQTGYREDDAMYTPAYNERDSSEFDVEMPRGSHMTAIETCFQ